MKRQEFASPVEKAQPARVIASPEVVQALVTAKAVMPLDSLEHIYHGRAGTDAEEWGVDPFFVSTNLWNVYENVFYATASRQDAQDFANARSREIQQPPHLVELVPTKPNLGIITRNVPVDLGRKLLVGFSTGSPPSSRLEETALLTVVDNLVQVSSQGVSPCGDSTIKELAETTLPDGQDPKEWAGAIRRYCLVYNSYWMIASGHLMQAANVMLGHSVQTVKFKQQDTDEFIDQKVTFSKEYIQEVYRRAGIIGVQKTLNSATIGRQIKDTIVIWDTSGLQEADKQEARTERERMELQHLGNFLSEFINPAVEAGQFSQLRNAITDPYTNPRQIIEQALQYPDLANLLQKPSGVWEGYTVAEHTEAVLQMFERYYADNIPVEFVGFLKTALFLHDIGKGVAAEKDRLDEQAQFNRHYAGYILDRMNFSDDAKNVILQMIGPGAKHFSNIYRYGISNKDLIALDKMLSQVMRDDDGKDSFGILRQLHQILYVCDVGAYTSLARYTKAVDRRNMVVQAIPSLDGVIEPSTYGSVVRLKTKRDE